MAEDVSVERRDKYNIVVDGVTVVADTEQERRIAALTPEQRERFAKIMGGGRRG